MSSKNSDKPLQPPAKVLRSQLLLRKPRPVMSLSTCLKLPLKRPELNRVLGAELVLAVQELPAAKPSAILTSFGTTRTFSSFVS